MLMLEVYQCLLQHVQVRIHTPTDYQARPRVPETSAFSLAVTVLYVYGSGVIVLP